MSPSSQWGRWIDRLGEVMLMLAAAAIVVMMVGMTAYGIGRKLGHPLPMMFELSEQLMVIAYAFPLAAVTLGRRHLVFELVNKLLGPAAVLRLEGLGYLLGAVLFGSISLRAGQAALKAYQIGEFRQGVVDLPIWPFRWGLALAVVIFTLALVVMTVRCWAAAARQTVNPKAPE